MAIKIPDSPNIIGGQAVLRQPSSLHGTTVTPDFRTDIKAPTEAFAKLAGAYAEHVASQNRVLMTEVQNHYLKRMSDEVNEIKRTHQLKDAADLYPLMRQASDKIVQDLTGAAKDDGQLRIANKDFKEQFVQWVAEQQPTYISKAATYGASEWQKYAQMQADQNDIELTNLILGADSEITIQNAIRGFMQNAQSRFPGGDPRHVAAYAAAKVDSAVSARLMKDIPNDPLGVLNMLRENKTVQDSLSSESVLALREEAIKSYEGLATRYYAESIATNGASGSEGLVAKEVMKQVYGTDDEFVLDSKKRAIEAGAQKMADANKKETIGIRAKALSRATNAFMLAKNQQERQQALKQIAETDPEAARIMNESWYGNAQFVSDLAVLDLGGGYDQIDDTRSGFMAGNLRKYLESRLRDYGKQVGVGSESWSKMTERELLDLNETLPSEYKLTVGELEAARAVSYQQLSVMGGLRDTYSTMASYDRVKQEYEKRKNAIPKYMELSRRQATGEQVALDGESLKDMPYSYVYQLNQQGLVMSDYYNRRDELKQAYGIDLQNLIQDIVPDFKNYSIPSQNAFYRNVVQAIPKGQMPSSSQLDAIIRSAANAAVVPEDAALRGVLLDHGVLALSAQNIDPLLTPRDAREALDEASATTPYDAAFTTSSKARVFTKTSDKTYENSREKAGEILDDYAKLLNDSEQAIIETFRDDLIDVVMAGEWVMLSTMVSIQSAY